jgi:hypothetical protein
MTDEELLNLVEDFFYYDEAEGHLFNKVTRSSMAKKDTRAGSLTEKGYIRIRFKNKNYMEHRLIFLLHNGYMPEIIDHIDGQRDNNFISNLREASNSENAINSKLNSTNKTGFRGVSFFKKSNKFRASIQKNGLKIHLGLFNTAEEASIAYKTAAAELHGDFTRE